MARKVLLTNYQMIGFSGSELDTLKIANYFLGKNYDVTIFTLRYGYPLLSEIDERIKIVTSKNIGDMVKKYDIIWSHHFPLLDYLLFFQGISANYIHYVSLSSFSDYECLPEYYKELNLNSIISFEGKIALSDENYDVSNINLFTNYASKYCFEYKIRKHILKKICIVSNHIPNELYDFVRLFSSRKGKTVDIYGRGHNYVRVTPKLLSKYDLIITIGRTVNDALALGIPVYCYDRFGGDGFITMRNVDNSYKFNFSGRYSHIKKDGLKLFDDIVNNYKYCVKDLSKLRKFAYDNFCFEKMMADSLKKLRKTKKFVLRKVITNYPHLVRKAPLFYNRLNDEITKLNKYENNIYYGQIYFDYGDGFNENNSLIRFYKFENNKHVFEARIPNRVRKIRFDFSDLKYSKIDNIYINDKKIRNLKFLNCINLKRNCYISINDDPSFIFKNNNYKKIKIVFDMCILSSEDILNEMCKSGIFYRKIRMNNDLKKFSFNRKD